mmetsp:Transcript_3696/g.7909  ORF Transcript_3696/g.7909 Transcript_3696/m.7909 type:complete len:145 (+) Transcript_3696:25-459(+)
MDLHEIYARHSKGLKARFLRAGYAYKSVLTGINPVISASAHDYPKFKAFLIYLGAFTPVLFKNTIIQKSIAFTRSNKRWVVIPTVAACYSVLIPAGASIAYLTILSYSCIRSMYFASYLATLAFFIDDPNHRAYRESKIMRNAL